MIWGVALLFHFHLVKGHLSVCPSLCVAVKPLFLTFGKWYFKLYVFVLKDFPLSHGIGSFCVSIRS